MATHRQTLWTSLGVATALAGTLPAVEEQYAHGSVTAYIENDVFAGLDREYSSGLRFSWLSHQQQNHNDLPTLPRLFAPLLGTETGAINKLWGSPSYSRFRYGYSLTQFIYTPVESGPIAPPDERPYAGWVGIGLALQAESERTFNSIELSVGVLGKSSLAEQTQEFVHSWGNYETFLGWDSQLPQEPTFNLYFNHKRRYQLGKTSGFLTSDLIPEVGGALGTYRTDAYAGVTFRIGHGLDRGFSDQRLSMTSTTGAWETTSQHKNTFYFLLGGRVTGVLHDISLDGNVFRDYTPIVDKRSIVAEAYAGVSFRHKNFELSYTHSFRTREYKQQNNSQEFGTVIFRWYF